MDGCLLFQGSCGGTLLEGKGRARAVAQSKGSLWLTQGSHVGPISRVVHLTTSSWELSAPCWVRGLFKTWPELSYTSTLPLWGNTSLLGKGEGQRSEKIKQIARWPLVHRSSVSGIIREMHVKSMRRCRCIHAHWRGKCSKVEGLNSGEDMTEMELIVAGGCKRVQMFQKTLWSQV